MKEAESIGFFLFGATTFWQDFFRVLRFFVGACIVLGNGFIFMAFAVQKVRRPTRVRVRRAGIFVLNNLIADAFFGTVILALSHAPPLGLHWCGVMAGGLYLATMGCHVAAFNMFIDRLMVVFYPVRYKHYMTNRRSRFVVLCGWLLPLAGMVAGILLDSHPRGPESRCADIDGVRVFLTWFYVPSHVLMTLGLIAVQFMTYLRLRRRDRGGLAIGATVVVEGGPVGAPPGVMQGGSEGNPPTPPIASPPLLREEHRPSSNRNLLKFSNKTTIILLYFTIPNSLLILVYFSLVVLLMWDLNAVPNPKLLHSILLLGVEVSWMLNAVVYSYATENIQKPVSDLLRDLRRWWSPRRPSVHQRAPPTRPEARVRPTRNRITGPLPTPTFSMVQLGRTARVHS